ncbi:putative AbiEi antitoxin of type IV toxin-antitoxin system [Kribbella antiqua]|uniref:Putative AbiEi antitoxin of type IV toxin-antitoxin system n=1 Tax=Kribbella antiqua TaxID=2512217 RepID=A0A4R2IDE3_9ACTN|nr:type IV toxin-antitoxin system AbiEi family antitoxin domain-containing protein [Kribbella antiqua]TCO41568.1 putative AbiEi antitoxin of type IV toxin-antitoxin system [Kribbella antiqua]
MNPQLAVMATIRGGVFTRADARACGYPDPDIDTLLDSGGWRRIRRNTYAAHRALTLVTDHVLHLRKLYRVLLLDPAVVASHQSAAALHALPLWGIDLSQVHITAADGRSGCIGGVHRHIRDPVGPGVQLWNKLRMVSPARAVAEVAATSSAAPAVVLTEAALHAGLVSKRTLKHAAARLDHGSDRAFEVISRCTGSASIAESRLRFILAEAGLPAPSTLPPPVDAEEGAAAALWFPDERTVLEFEPRFPFWSEEFEPDEEDPTPAPASALTAPEPLEHCWISWADLNDPPLVVERVRSTFARASRRTGVRYLDVARI